jgi:tetratricopeptide (TPR) repeat protein
MEDMERKVRAGALSTISLILGLVVPWLGGLAMMAPDSRAGDQGAASTLPDFTKLWDFNHPDSTEAEFRAILPQARVAGDADYTAQLLTQIARAEGLQRKFEAAHKTLDEAEAMITPTMQKARVRYLLERGRTLNSSGKPAEAKPLFVAAWDLAREAKEDGLAVDAAHMIAIVEPPDSSIVWNERAMGFAEASSDPRAQGWLGSLYNNLGWSYHDKGDYAKALEVFQKGWDWRKTHNQPAEARIAKWTVARALRSLGRYEEALAMQRELLAEHEAAGGQDGFVFEEMGECLFAMGLGAEARPWFAKAYEVLSKDPWLAEQEKDRLKRLADLGGLAPR